MIPERESTCVKKTALVVLGMHRSGTSSLSGTLIKLGACSPKTLMPAGIGNELGHFESSAIVELNDRLLASADTRWDDWRPVNADRIAAPAISEFERDAARTLEEEYGSATLIAIKDPRMCRIFPLWLSTLERSAYAVRVMMPVRSPLEVAQSLRARDDFTISKGLLLWLRHMLDAERDTRAVPRTFLLWTEFLADWRLSIARASEEVGLVWPIAASRSFAEIDQWILPGLRHNIAPPETLTSHPDVNDWVRECYRAMEELAADPVSTSARMRLDDVRRDFDKATAVVEQVKFEPEERAAPAGPRIDNSKEDIELLAARAATASAERPRLSEQLAAMSIPHETVVTHSEKTLCELAPLQNNQRKRNWDLSQSLFDMLRQITRHVWRSHNCL